MAAALPAVTVMRDGVSVRDAEAVRARLAGRLAATAVAAPDPALREEARWLILECARALGLWPASLHGYLSARGKGYYAEVTVPVIAAGAARFGEARACFRGALLAEAPALALDIDPGGAEPLYRAAAEFSAVMLAAALAESVRGPVFLQASHCRVTAAGFRVDRAGEMETARSRIKNSLMAGVYNLHLDTSSLVEPGRASLGDRHRESARAAAELTHHIRSHEPRGLVACVTAACGVTGGAEGPRGDAEAFMEAYLAEFDRLRPGALALVALALPPGTRGQEGVARRLRERFQLAGLVERAGRSLAATQPDEDLPPLARLPDDGTCAVLLAPPRAVSGEPDAPAVPPLAEALAGAARDLRAAGTRGVITESVGEVAVNRPVPAGLDAYL